MSACVRGCVRIVHACTRTTEWQRPSVYAISPSMNAVAHETIAEWMRVSVPRAVPASFIECEQRACAVAVECSCELLNYLSVHTIVTSALAHRVGMRTFGCVAGLAPVLSVLGACGACWARARDGCARLCVSRARLCAHEWRYDRGDGHRERDAVHDGEGGEHDHEHVEQRDEEQPERAQHQREHQNRNRERDN
eukprot:5736800-Pleurochrysis_carterae.AAC.1